MDGYQHYVKCANDCHTRDALKLTICHVNAIAIAVARTQRREAHCRQTLRRIIDPRELESDSFRTGRSQHANGTSLCFVLPLLLSRFYVCSLLDAITTAGVT